MLRFTFSSSSCRGSRSHDLHKSRYPERNKKNPSPKTLFRKQHQRQLLLHEMLETTRSERDDAHKLLSVLQERLHRAEDQLTAIMRQAEKERKLHEQDLQYLFFEYLLSNGYKLCDLLGPIQHEMVESRSRVGDYAIRKFLGDGSFSNVLHATHRTTGQDVALKVFEKERCSHLPTLEQLEKELRVLQFVDHPNIVKLEQVIHAPKNIYIAMELGYSDAFQYFHEHWDDLTTNVLREFTVGVLRGIKYLHANGIAHMDIKAENVLITRNVGLEDFSRQHVRICDLGLSNLHHGRDGAIPVRRLCGTPGFFAPELVLDVKNAKGQACDMWSVGAMLMEWTEGLGKDWLQSYEYFQTNRRLFRKSLLEAMKNYFSFQDHSDPHLHSLICWLLTWDPKKRPTAVEALHHPWFWTKRVENNDNAVLPC